MSPFTVVISDVLKHDHGLKATKAYWKMATYVGAYAELGLFWFLSEYFGRSKVRLLRPSELLPSSADFHTDWLFVGIPTSLDRRHLDHIKFKKLVLYDATDFDGVNFDDSPKAVLLNETATCLKSWRDHRWKEDLNVGLLPIKRPPWNSKLPWMLQLMSLKHKYFGRKEVKEFDVGFVARPTGTIKSNQRLRWLVEIKKERPEWKLFGGLVGGDEWRSIFADSEDLPYIESLWLNRRKMDYLNYFRGLSHSKVALAPRGYAPWTFRHFEAIYARCVVVSNDLSQFDFLVPFPRHGMIEVADGAPIVPAIDAGLKIYREQPEVLDENIRHLEQWLASGRYSRTRAETLDRFMVEIERAA